MLSLERGDFMEQNIFEKLNIYNDDEIFYREYYQCRNNPKLLKELILNVGKDEINRRGLLVAEVNDTFSIPFEMNDTIFYEKETQNICLSKHNRYTPEFLHSHTFFEMIYVLSGSCKHTVAGKSIIMSSGTFCIVAPHVYHTIGVFDDSIVLNILIKASTLGESYGTLLKSNNTISSFLINAIFAPKYVPFLQFYSEPDSNFQGLILSMYQEQCNADKYSEEIINHLMSIFLYQLLRSSCIKTEFSEMYTPNNNVTEIYRYFLKHYQNTSLEELAELLGYTPTYCSVYIKKVTGFTFSKLRKIALFNKAKEFLIHTSLSISNISESLGYHDSESFIRAFQKEFGISPAKFRKHTI